MQHHPHLLRHVVVVVVVVVVVINVDQVATMTKSSSERVVFATASAATAG
jgi:hypothetical protein